MSLFVSHLPSRSFAEIHCMSADELVRKIASRCKNRPRATTNDADTSRVTFFTPRRIKPDLPQRFVIPICFVWNTRLNALRTKIKIHQE